MGDGLRNGTVCHSLFGKSNKEWAGLRHHDGVRAATQYGPLVGSLPNSALRGNDGNAPVPRNLATGFRTGFDHADYRQGAKLVLQCFKRNR